MTTMEPMTRRLADPAQPSNTHFDSGRAWTGDLRIVRAAARHHSCGRQSNAGGYAAPGHQGLQVRVQVVPSLSGGIVVSAGARREKGRCNDADRGRDRTADAG
jgi:hypothetical protein